MNADNRKGNQACPARMSDARLFTTYLSADRLNHMLARKFGIKDMSHEFRHFMTRNAVQIKEMEDQFFREQYMCSFHNPKSLHYSLFQRE